MGKPVEGSYYSQARAAMKRLGEFTVSQIRSELGAMYPAPLAISAFRSYLRAERKRLPLTGKRVFKTYSMEDMIRIGRQSKINIVIHSLNQFGYIERLGPSRYRYVGKESPPTFTDLVKEAVASLGECTITQVVEMVGHHASEERAVKAFQRARRLNLKYRNTKNPYYSPREGQIALGRRVCVSEALGALEHRGKIRRVRTGVYAPLEPVSKNDKH